MNPDKTARDARSNRPLLHSTRRQFFADAGFSIGGMGLMSLLADNQLRADDAAVATDPLAVRPTHFPARAKRVIYLFMAGGPSQLELFDYKPELKRMSGDVIPESYVANKRFAFLKKDAKLLGTKRDFRKWGESGVEMSELVPGFGSIADEVAVIRTMKTAVFNHGPAKLYSNTGFQRFGRPAMGAWVTYGIGSESRNLPGYVVLQSGPRGPRGGTPLWGNGFLPSTYQGVPFLNTASPILNLASPDGVDAARQQDFVNTVNDLNRARLKQVQDPEIATRIATYEMAYRMQSSAPELMDMSDEPQTTLDMYRADPGKPSFARNCLLARRLVQKGVRFVQLYHTDWDHHGNPGTNLGKPLEDRCQEVDQPAAALVKDLKRLGMLDDTLVIWGGEFGRTPQGEPRDLIGRDHHIESYAIWMAGGGVKGGQMIGRTDDLGYYAVEDEVPVHDLQATVLHLLGLDHLKLTYRFQARDYRLTDIGGEVVNKLIA
ncbi:MAG: DUF1501 domain-containing protein [Pirellulaceae bacterium]|jgi:hypothetical protein|nr:DUF1501 domain-containing protein [Pirellulaceae bacterium]